MAVHLGLRHQSAPHGLGDALIHIVVATLHVGSGSCAHGGSMRGVTRCLVALPEVAHGTAVAHHQILESPLVAQNLLQQSAVAAAGFVVQSLIGTHHLPDLGILHQGLEGRQIRLLQVAQRHVVQVGRMAGVLRSAVHGIVLGTGPQLAVAGRLGALQSAHHLGAHDAGQVGVLAVGLLPTSPARVAEDVHVRRPHAQAVELLVLAAALHAVVILGTLLGAGDVEHLVEEVGIERRSHSHRFREDGHVVLVGGPVQGLAPPEELLDAQSRNGGRLVQHQLGLLLQRQSLTQVSSTLARREVGILVRQLLCRCTDAHHQCQG